MYPDEFDEERFDDFPALPWAEDPVGYWHFEPDLHCQARFASGLTWKEPGDLLHVEVAGELNARWAGGIAGSSWECPPFAGIESIVHRNAPLSGGPDGLYTSRGILSVTRIETAGGVGTGPAPTQPWTVAALIHGDGENLFQCVTVVTRPDRDGGRVPLTLDGDAALELWADAGTIGMEAFQSALGL